MVRMGAIRVVARADLRRNWRGTVVVALLVGLVGGVTLATIAGARRSDRALDRFDAYSHTANLEITVGNATPGQIENFERSPGVARVAVLQTLAIQSRDQALGNLAIGAATDNTFGTAVDRPQLVTGRLANLAAPDEGNIGESLASQFHLRVGGRLLFDSFPQPQVERLPAGPNARP